MTTPSKPDLVALAERLEKFQRVLESAQRQDNKIISVWSDDPIVVAEAVSALRHLASQPSLYESGQRVPGWKAVPIEPTTVQANAGVDADDMRTGYETVKHIYRRMVAEAPPLPADGGEGKPKPYVPETEDEANELSDNGRNTGGKSYYRSPSDPTPSTAGSVREALEKPPFHFDRYINGKLMAEGVCIEKRETLKDAMVEAARIASKGAHGETPVLVYVPAALSAPVEAPVAVKQLEWNEYEDGEGQAPDRWDAETACGTFYGIALLPDGFSVEYDYRAVAKSLASLDAAKAAAQADYEQRIRSALIATPRPLPSVDRVAQSALPTHWTNEHAAKAAWMINTLAITPVGEWRSKSEIHETLAEFRALTLLGGSAHG